MKKLIIITMLWSLPALAEEPKSVLYNWQTRCASCHGSEGDAEDLYDSAKNDSAESILAKVRICEKKDKKNIPLTEEEMRELSIHIEYSALVKKVLDRRKRLQSELNHIKRDYKELPECEKVQEIWPWK
jgi:cytochrome c553